MKMRNIFFCYTAVVLFLLFLFAQEMTKENSSQIDMVYFNRQMKQVEEELSTSSHTDSQIQQIEKNYHCTILFPGEKDYESRLQALTGESAIIFDYYENGCFTGKVAWNTQKNQYETWKKLTEKKMLFLFLCFILCGYALLLIIYLLFVRPFHVLKRFSREIAKGNLDFPLPMKKYNTFGAFTESFDLMREELKKAKESEYQANISKKELVAELSHDIKTPVSTIKATCEVLQVKENNPDTADKIHVIFNKANTIEQLVDNMFHATMEELETLKVEVTEESSLSIPDMFRDFQYFGNITLENSIPECLLCMDKLRLEQVIGNVIHNSYKYAGTSVTVRFWEDSKSIKIQIHDTGAGVPEEELALITEKFYRGSNTKGKSGSGLGLYLAKNFMERMEGALEYYNDHGFTVELYLKKV